VNVSGAALALAGCSADRSYFVLSFALPLIAKKERQDVDLFLLHGLELIGVKAEDFDDGRRDLLVKD